MSSMTNSFATGRYLRRWRTKLKLSYEDVAEALGVHPITVRNWEKSARLKPITKIAFDAVFRRNFRPGWMYRRASSAADPSRLATGLGVHTQGR